jgi:hypothetical protein
MVHSGAVVIITADETAGCLWVFVGIYLLTRWQTLSGCMDCRSGFSPTCRPEHDETEN